MITMHLHTRPNRSWVATAMVDGATHRVVANDGASNKLAGILKRRGVKDQPVRIYNPRPGQDYSEHPSLYAWADFDYQRELKAWLQAG